MIVIDESHNFRNGGNVDEELEIRNEELGIKENRYQRLMNKVIRSGVKTKVSPITVKRDLADLQAKGIIAREGGRKNGRWVIQKQIK